MKNFTKGGMRSVALSRWGLAGVVGATVGVIYLSGCENSESGGAEGTSIVQGRVESFSAGGVTYRPMMNGKRGFDLVSALSDLLVPRAEAAVAGVMVHMSETDLTTMTDESGAFVMTGAPSGHRRMEFTYNETTSMMEIDVPENATVTMGNVRCSGTQATADHMDVKMHGSAASSDMMDNPRERH